jgi:hypothetical protein
MAQQADGSGFEPSEWFAGVFGEQSEGAAHALLAASNAAHGRASDAKTGSGLRTNEAYGATFWMALPEELVNALGFYPGLEILKPRNARYELPVCDETLILAVKMPADGRGPDELRFKSAFRRRVLSLRPLDETNSMLDFTQLEGFELTDADGDPVVITGEFGTAKRVVLVAVECSARGGVQRIYVGDVILLAEGHIFWTHREELPLALLSGTGAGLVGLDLATEVSSFTAAPIPEAPLGLVEDDAATGDNGRSEVEDTGAEGAVDDGS